MKCSWASCHNDILHASCCSVPCITCTCGKFSLLHTVCRYLLNPLMLALLVEGNEYFYFHFSSVLLHSHANYTLTHCTLYWLKQKRESNGKSDKITLPFVSSTLNSSGKIWGWAFTSKLRLSQLVCSREEPATVPTASKIFWVTSYKITRQYDEARQSDEAYCYLGNPVKSFFTWNLWGWSKVGTYLLET